MMKNIHWLAFLVAAVLATVLTTMSCVGISASNNSAGSGNTGDPPASNRFTGVLMWKGDTSGSGLYSSETTLTPANVNVTQFGKLADFQADGLLAAQPLYVSNVDMVGA